MQFYSADDYGADMGWAKARRQLPLGPICYSRLTRSEEGMSVWAQQQGSRV